MRTFLITCLLLLSSLLGATTLSYDFGDTSKGLTGRSTWNPESPWSNLTTQKCYQRYYGIGLGSRTESRFMGMHAIFEEAIPIQMITLRCYASSNNATGKIATLTVKGLFQDGTTETVSCIFETTVQSTESMAVPYVLTFTFQSTALLSKLEITNTSSDDFFVEVGNVSLHREMPPLQAVIEVEETLCAGTTASATVVSLEGGDGIYEDYTFCWFLDDEPTHVDDYFIAQTLREPFSFIVPEEEGEHKVTFRVIDTNGNVTDTSATFKSDLQAPPSNIKITNMTRTGFDVSWEVNGPVAPAQHRVRLVLPSTIETSYTPQWITNTKGEKIALLSLSMFTDNFIEGLNSLRLLTSVNFSTAPMYSFDGEEWSSTVFSSESYHFFALSAFKGKASFYLKIAAEEREPQHLNFVFESESPMPIFDERYDADGKQKAVSFRQLPSGATCLLTIDAVYANGNTKTVTLEIQLPALDPFVTIKQWGNFLEFTWPNDETIETGAYAIYADFPMERQGVFLSRLFYATGEVGGKGIVLTNTTNEAIDLCDYRLRYTRPSGSTADWTMEGYTLAAKSEIIFVYPNAKITLPTDAIEISATAMNFTNGGLLTLYKGDTIINSLNVKSKSISRLMPSTQGETFIAYTEDLEMKMLWSAWSADTISTKTKLQTNLFNREGLKSVRTMDVDTFVLKHPNATAFWVELYTIENETKSESLWHPFWELKLSEGYLLRLK